VRHLKWLEVGGPEVHPAGSTSEALVKGVARMLTCAVSFIA